MQCVMLERTLCRFVEFAVVQGVGRARRDFFHTVAPGVKGAATITSTWMGGDCTPVWKTGLQDPGAPEGAPRTAAI